MPHAVFGLDPALYRPHALHRGERHWPQTNCYVDLWIEVLASLGQAPEAMLGFTLAQDFEGDHFTFFKVPLEDLDTLYGLRVAELAIFDRLETHVAAQLRRERLVLVEVDGFHLPDTQGVSYGRQHTKTTVAINGLDPARRRMTYFHNDGYFALDGDDYDGVFGLPGGARDPAALFPYAEFVKLDALARPADLAGAARARLAFHLARLPGENPIRAYGRALASHLDELSRRPPEYFHVYSFNTLRQLGANFELLASHLAWLARHGVPGLEAAGASALAIAEGAKLAQFKLARAVARRRFDGMDPVVAEMAARWDDLAGALAAALSPAAVTLDRRAA